MTVGTYEKLRSGKVSARLPRSVDPKRRRLGTFASDEEAKGIINASLAMAIEGSLTVAEGQTFRSFLRGYLDRREQRGARDNENTRNVSKNHLEDADFVDWPLTSIKRVHVRDWLDRLQRKHAERTGKRLSPQTVRNALNLLRTCLGDAVDRGVIEDNPARDVRVPRSINATTEDKWTHLTPEEQDALLKAVPEAERNCVAFAIWTGLRQSEQWCLHLADVHVDGTTPHVVVRYGKKGKPTKNGKIRKVPLFGTGLDVAQAQIKALKGKRNPHKLLFPSIRGEYRQQGAPRGWENWPKDAGIKKRVRWHDLRHTCASSLICGWRGGQTWPLSHVCEFMGHSDIKMTQRYAHLDQSALREMVATTEAAIRAPQAKLDETQIAQLGESATAETVVPTEAELRGPQADQNGAQVIEMPEFAAQFLNRRSQVRLLSGALNSS